MASLSSAAPGAYTQNSVVAGIADALNEIAREGWDFHSVATAFINEGEVSRDKFLASGQQVAVRGRLVGTYVFTRRNVNGLAADALRSASQQLAPGESTKSG